MDAYRDKLGEWVAASKGHIRADRAHSKLVGLGYGGSERTTRRAVADAKQAWEAGHGRVCRRGPRAGLVVPVRPRRRPSGCGGGDGAVARGWRGAGSGSVPDPRQDRRGLRTKSRTDEGPLRGDTGGRPAGKCRHLCSGSTPYTPEDEPNTGQKTQRDVNGDDVREKIVAHPAAYDAQDEMSRW